MAVKAVETGLNTEFRMAWFRSVFEQDSYQTTYENCFSFFDILDNPWHKEKKYTHLFVLGKAGEKDGVRTVFERDAVVLDADCPKPDFLERCYEFFDNGDFSAGTMWGYYTSARATREQPRYRIIVLLDTVITDSEIYRRLCSAIMHGIAPDDIYVTAENREFDWCSNEMSRLMYLPTKPKSDTYYDWGWYDGKPLNVKDAFDWISYWDYSEVFAVHGDKSGNKKGGGKTRSSSGRPFTAYEAAQNPADKDSIVGSFCKVFDSIEKTIIEYDLPYTQCGSRWIYDGSTSGIPGVSIDGPFLLSLHESDPANTGHLVNSYDLVRLHKNLNEHEMYRLAIQNPQVREVEVERARAYKQKHSL